MSVERVRQYFNNKQETLDKPVQISPEEKKRIHQLVPPKPI